MEQKFLNELPRNEKGLLDRTKCYNLSPIAGGGKVLEDYSNYKSVSSKEIHEAFVAANPEFKGKSFEETHKAVCLKEIHEVKILEFPKLANFSSREVQAFCCNGKIQQIEIREAQTNFLIVVCSSSIDAQEKLGTNSGNLRSQLRDQNFRRSGTLPAPLLGPEVRIRVKSLPPLTGEDLK